jgi:hypothetical protein
MRRKIVLKIGSKYLIENMEKTNQVKVLIILKRHTDVTINENKKDSFYFSVLII